MNELPVFPVAIHCITYNHALYIKDAMNGFCMQQTTFPFVAIIIDDASTDGEPAVIENYLNSHFDLSTNSEAKRWETDESRFIFVRHKENRNCYFAVVLLKTNFYSQHKSKAPFFNIWDESVKYIALCEGDDYWTDSTKLQKQYNAMESSPDYSISYCLVNTVDKGGKKQHWTIPPRDILLSHIISLEINLELDANGRWAFHTSSFFFREKMYSEYLNLQKTVFKHCPYGDLPLNWTCLLFGKGVLIKEYMSCYRLFSGGYVSSVTSTPQKWLNDELGLIVTFRDFDEYTHYQYTELLRKRIELSYERIHDKFYFGTVKLNRDCLKILLKRSRNWTILVHILYLYYKCPIDKLRVKLSLRSLFKKN